jgi:signal transduction histidine kinase
MLLQPNTIRSQMLSALGTLVMAVIVLLVAVTLYVTQHQLYELGQRDARDRVDAIAARAAFAAIVGLDSPEVAQQLTTETTGVDGILATELVSPSGRAIGVLEEVKPVIGGCQFPIPSASARPATSLKRLRGAWCISAPILKRTDAGVCTAPNCVLGYIRAAASTASVDTIVKKLIAAILFLGSLLLAGALALVWRVSGRISRPLLDIANVMRRRSAAKEYGPEEAITISKVYNELIDAQQRHAAVLEETVERRTEQLRAATLEAQDAVRYRTIFMAHASHDMRTPVHLIRSFAADVLNELEFTANTQVAQEHVKVIIHQSTELASRVQQILELTRVDSGRTKPNLTSLSISVLRGQVLQQAETLAKTQRNKLTLIADDGLIWTDAEKVLQILTNLIDNASKFTTDGTIDVSLRLDDGEFRVTVVDNGIGIAEESLPHIWSEFRQGGPSSYGPKIPGFGLGLAIVRQYVLLLGGHYGAQSRLGKGTTVWVALPAGAPGTPERYHECSATST